MSRSTAELEDADVEKVYGAPLEEFVRERDALARRLRDEGRRDEAEAAKRLAKPSIAAWSVNELARKRRRDVQELFAAADRLRKVQSTGRGDFAAAVTAERDALAKLVDGAAELLRDAGRAAGDATLARVAGTLQAAAADPGARAAIEQGRLTREMEPAGFGSLLVGLPGEAGQAPAPPRKAEERERPRRSQAKEAARKALSEARARAKDLRREADRAERAVAEARRALERTERDAERARKRAEEADVEATRAQRRLRDL